MRLNLKKQIFFLAIAMVLISCSRIPTGPAAVVSEKPDSLTLATPISTKENLVQPTAASKDAQTALKIKTVWIDPVLPTVLRAGIVPGSHTTTVDARDQAEISVSLLKSGDPSVSEVEWVYVVAAKFPTVEDNVSLQQLKLIWKGDGTERLLLLDAETLGVFSYFWGEPSSAAIQVLPADELLQAAWDTPDTYALFPFDEIEPRWKILQVDGLDPLDKTMDERLYPLSFKVGTSSQSPETDIRKYLQLPPSNREAENIISLDMTGVTALVRGTARMMNERGVLFPAQDIGTLLSSADLTHISNEVSFNQDCSPLRAASTDGAFCSAPEYINLLDEVGADIIELTGNHNLDKGVDGYLYSLKQYQDRGWLTYGGGINQEAAKQAVLVERGQTKLAFLGCNWAGPDFAWATKIQPGAAQCDMEWLSSQIEKYRADGYLPIVTFQSFETDDYMPAPMQRPTDYAALSQAGAVIVSGSQAHFPQGLKFEGQNFVHFGLGNLFFDQMQPPATRKAFIDRHIFYKDKYLGVELVTIKLEDSARPRLMTATERAVFLARVFTESGWEQKQP